MDQQSGASKGNQHHGGQEEVRYKGVSFQQSGKYLARIRDKNKEKSGESCNLGTFPTAEDAARAYDRAALAMGCHIATLNFPQEYGFRPFGNASTMKAAATSSTTVAATTGEVFEIECVDDNLLEELLDPDQYNAQVNK